ncbi:MAG: hypothetical protein ONB44_06080 [candidate division KSB1 bacterium]|nr:hypothetical protein [candidate division KSB1 bacterium]MDZ7301690.1 hypothetical protein [candidate division KSB1 bacterium]MDZ7312423.1 hypothetical protein [candidate division KSB1 bacterium]
MEFIKKLWRRFRLPLFIILSGAFAIIDKWKTDIHLDYVTIYILVVTIFIIIVQRSNRETPRMPRVPELQLIKQRTKAGKLRLSEILIEEFDYVKETASQAMNDRHTMVNYFLLSAGVVLAGSGVMVSAEGGITFPYRYEILIALNLLFNAVGWVYFMQVVRLRQAWCESARAMNHIKSVFTKNCEFFPQLARKAFRWNIKTIPPAERKMTVFYFSALLIGILSAAAITLSSIILVNIKLLREADTIHQAKELPSNFLWMSFGLGLYHLFFQMSMYTAFLEEPTLPKAKPKETSAVRVAHHLDTNLNNTRSSHES